MTPLLVFLTFVCFGIVINGKKKIRRDINFFDENKEGLKEVFPDVKSDRKICRYYFSGDLNSILICDNEFECKDCPVHKRFINSVLFVDESNFCIKDVCGLSFSPCLFYHRGHTCVNIGKNGSVLIGIDSFILKTVGKKAEKVVLPEVGDFVEANEIAFSLIHNGEYFPVLSPISGEVTGINERMIEDFKENQSFVWLCAVKPFELNSELQSLLSGKEAEEWLKYDLNSLKEFAMRERAFSADGGEVDFSALKFETDDFVKNFLLSYRNEKY